MEREEMINLIVDFLKNLPKYKNRLNISELLKIMDSIDDEDLEDYIKQYNLK